MTPIGIVGTGFVADLYLRSLATFPDLALVAAHDRDASAQARFCRHWKVAAADDLSSLLDRVGPGGIVLNLTNPTSHAEVSRACLQAGIHVYSEKPLALTTTDAADLVALAKTRGLLLASAPCSFLSETAQTLAAAIRSGVAGRPRLIYAELDDDFIAQAPYRRWHSESGAPWPAEDEFRTGCTLEHAGYYLTWLMAVFGPVHRVVSASASLGADLLLVPDPAPDFATATLVFGSGVAARLTCSILAPHDHGLSIIGDRGVLTVAEAWNNAAPVTFRRRFTLRRRLVNAPLARRIRLGTPTHPKVGRWGAAAMNFALGPKEMAESLAENRPCRLSADFALHLTEVTLAIQAGQGSVDIASRFDLPAPMPWAGALKGAV